MKLRCTENSIRLRLRKSDLQQLAENGSVAESIHFPNNKSFVFELTVGETSNPTAKMDAATLQIILPKAQADSWINTSQVGIEYFEKLPTGQQLHLLIEKDFPCKDRDDEDKADTFQELVPDEGKTC
jgi:hypothetical protein